MFKSILGGLFLLALGLLPCAGAHAAPTGTISFTNVAGGNSVTASPGTSFNFKVFLNASVPTIGLDFFVNQIKDSSNNAPTNRFKVTTRTSTGGVYDDPLPADNSPTVTNYFLNTSPPDQGFSQQATTAAAAANTPNFVTQFTVSVDPLTPVGTYTLTPTFDPTPNNGGFIDTGNIENPFTTLTPLTVIVPEPGTIGLLLVGGMFAGMRRRRGASSAVKSVFPQKNPR